jgi:hypothetical protein
MQTDDVPAVPPPSSCSAASLISAATGWTLSPPYVFSGKPTRGTRLGARKKDGEPFQDKSGRWYVSHKGTVRRVQNTKLTDAVKGTRP